MKNQDTAAAERLVMHAAVRWHDRVLASIEDADEILAMSDESRKLFDAVGELKACRRKAG